MKIKVRSKSDRFMRAGMQFTKETQEIEADQKIYSVLRAEPMLIVEIVADEAGKTAKKGKE
ncbi:MAG: hypothetical protein HZB80_11320 [Deltaproteobacteria bacterium]|nr:hypothetical protein [Deltaproteobacteria bacterium]